jgi:hypothetical protein
MKNPAHKNVISELLKYELIDSDLKVLERDSKGTIYSHIGYGNGKGNGKGKAEGTPEPEPKIITDPFEGLSDPFDSPVFKTKWKEWVEYKRVSHKFSFADIKYEQIAINQVHKDSNGVLSDAIGAMQLAISNGWKGVNYEAYLKNKQSPRLIPDAELPLSRKEL